MTHTIVLPLEFSVGAFKGVFNPAAIQNGSGIVLVDCGNPGFLPKLEEAMVKAGLSPSDIRKIVITHHDGDHIGALKALVDKYPGIEVLSSKEQAEYIAGRKKPLRLTLAEERYAVSTDAQEKKELEAEFIRLRAIETIGAVTAVRDGEVLPEGGGIELIEVSGHMPGHLCVYVKADKTLITGDALTSQNGRLCPPDSNFTLDMPTALKSLEKLLPYEIDTVVCYHGGVVVGGIRQRLEEIIKTGR